MTGSSKPPLTRAVSFTVQVAETAGDADGDADAVVDAVADAVTDAVPLGEPDAEEDADSLAAGSRAATTTSSWPVSQLFARIDAPAGQFFPA